MSPVNISKYFDSRLSGQCFFYGFDDCVKSSWVADRDLGQRLSIELNTCLVEAVDKFAVTKSTHSAGRIDSRDPQASELSFFDTTVTESENASANQRFLDGPQHVTTTAAVSFCSLEKSSFCSSTS